MRLIFFNPIFMDLINKKFLMGLAISALVLAGCNTVTDDNMPPAPEPDEEEEEMMEEEVAFQNRIVMTNLSTIELEGEGFYGVNDGETRVVADFNMADPEESYFYEGWLVCDGVPYSTGALWNNEGLWVNYFASSDLPEVCEKYVLTLEPDDNDPAPGEHLAEGVMEGIAHNDIPNTPLWDDEYFWGAASEQTMVSCEDEHEFTLTYDGGNVYYVAEGGESTTLLEAVSGSGSRFASEDGSLEVLEKAGEYSVMEDGELVHGPCFVAL
jgi:hypothetical protein